LIGTGSLLKTRDESQEGDTKKNQPTDLECFIRETSSINGWGWDEERIKKNVKPGRWTLGKLHAEDHVDKGDTVRGRAIIISRHNVVRSAIETTFFDEN